MDKPVADLQHQLKEQIMPWVGLPYLLSGLILAIFDPENPGLISWSSMGLIILSVCGVAWLCGGRSLRRRTSLLSIGGIGIAVVAWQWYPRSHAHHTFLYPVLCMALTHGAGVGALLGLGATGLSIYLARTSMAPFAPESGLVASLGTLWSGILLLAAAQRPQTTLLRWMWDWYDAAQQNLEGARDRQVELMNTLDDLDLAHREVLRLNDLLTAAREAIDAARRAKERFVANVSHELRTPLNIIIGFSDEILERPDVYEARLPRALLDDVATIKRNSEHLAELVNDVLELAEADAGYTTLNREWVDLPTLIDAAVQGVTTFFDKKGLSLTARVMGDVPPVFCDAIRIRQVLLNLLSNAARFTAEGGAQLMAEANDGSVSISVADTGPGIASGQLQRLFEPFQQADPSVRRRYGGSGLGLAISKRFVEMHGGAIRVESQLDVGTTVTFTLPVDASAPERAIRRAFNPYAELSVRDRVSLATFSPPKARLLVVEEGRLLTSMLSCSSDDFEVTHVGNIEEARNFLRREPSAALVVNGDYPVRDLPSLIPPDSTVEIPVLCCSLPEHRDQLAQFGVVSYLIKPVLADALAHAIEDAAPHARRILLVDDDDEARALFVRILGHVSGEVEILEADTGQRALAIMREGGVDLLLLDLVMPGLDGFGVLAAKAADPALRAIPVVVLSARDPEREPVSTPWLAVSRQGGLLSRDLLGAIRALVQALPPRFGAAATLSRPREQRETRAPSKAFG